VPHVSTDGGFGTGKWSERGDDSLPKKAKDEEWGIISCVSMDSMDGSWTLILDEDLAW